jgi:Xaa-Pro aminopeptidase
VNTVQGAAEYRRRRQRLMGMMVPGSIAVIPGAGLKLRNRDVDFPFRQHSDFYYLSGFTEPDSVLVLCPGRAHGETILFCPERDPVHERWNGERLGPERATQSLGIDDAFPIGDLSDILPGMLEGRETIYITLGEHPEFDHRLLGYVSDIRAREAGGAISPGEFVSLKHLLHELRLIKSKGELKLMREAGRITSAAHERAMRACRPGMSEGQLEAELVYEFMKSGARHPSYPPIVGGGANACVLHYIANDARLSDGDLVLIDAGCEYGHYAADVTRTFPVNGKFSTLQAELYDRVLTAQAAAIDACRPGASFNAPHDAALAVLVDGLLELGIMKGEREAILEDGSYRAFCPHKTSHWLGLDVHDVGDYRLDAAWRELEPGMVLTVEPGIYVPDLPQDPLLDAVAPRWRGLGIRIEDDVLITAHGPELLTDAPKTREDIERSMAAR